MDDLAMLARDGSAADVGAALARGLPPDRGAAALWMAAAWQRPEIVLMLLDAGVPIDAPTREGTALAASLERGGAGGAVARMLLARGADIDAPGGELAWTALHAAAWRADVPCVEFLLAHRARPDRRDRRGETAFDLARGRTYNEFCDTFDLRRPREDAYREVERLLQAATPAD